MSSDMSLEDQLKQAQIDKTKAESKKLEREADATLKQVRSTFWSELIKVGGGVILGIGGAVAAYTQFENAELRAKYAKQDLDRAQQELSVATKAKETALKEVEAATKAKKEQEEAIKQLKVSLAQTTEQRNQAAPSLAKSRLVYVQFRGSLTREMINELRKHLKNDSFDAPGAERVAGTYDNIVKYFQDNDTTEAKQLAKSVETFFSAKGCPLSIRVVPGGSISEQPMEVWLAHSCKN
jgi:hypothetical protein